MTLATLTHPHPPVAPTASALCQGCDTRPAPRDGGVLCTRCGYTLVELLQRIRDDYGRLELQPGRHGSQGAAAPVGFKSKPPVAVAPLSLQTVPQHVRRGGHIADLALDVTGGGDPDNLARAGDPTLVVVGRVADRAREHGLLARLDGPRTIVGETLRLERVAGELADAWFAGSVLRALRSAAQDLRRALGEDDPGTPLGACPRCSRPVRALEDGFLARCAGRHEWRGQAAVRALAVELGDAWSDTAALAAYLDGVLGREVTGEAVRKRAARQGWSARGVGRRILYRLTDARWSYGLEAGPVVPPADEQLVPLLSGTVEPRAVIVSNRPDDSPRALCTVRRVAA